MRRLRQREVPTSAGRQRWVRRTGSDDVQSQKEKEHRMSARHPLAAPAALIGGLGLVTPAAARVSAQSGAVDAFTLTTGRLAGTVAALVALAGVVVGGLTLARSAGRFANGNRKRGAPGAGRDRPAPGGAARAPFPPHPPDRLTG